MSDLTTGRIAGAILAGGRSRRMGGFPKGNLQVEGRLSIVKRLIGHLAHSGIEDIVIVANCNDAYKHTGCRIISDRRTGFGPLAGVETALAHFDRQYEAVLCLPCDIPAFSSREISTLVEAFSTMSASVVFAETDHGRRHPLCAIVSSCLLPEVSAAIDMKLLCVDALWRHLKGRSVYFGDSDAFCNLNTWNDLKQWRRDRAASAGTGC